MNIQSLWHGHRYAYKDDLPTYRRRGQFPPNCIEIEVIGVRKFKSWDSERYSSRVKVRFVETGREAEVEPNKIHDFWDNYQDEKAHLEEERARRERERQEEYERKQRERAEKKQRVLAILAQLGIEEYNVTSVDDSTTYIRTQGILDLGERMT